MSHKLYHIARRWFETLFSVVWEEIKAMYEPVKEIVQAIGFFILWAAWLVGFYIVYETSRFIVPYDRWFVVGNVLAYVVVPPMVLWVLGKTLDVINKANRRYKAKYKSKNDE